MLIENRAFTLGELEIISAANEEIALLKQALLEMTNMLDEHPEGYDGPCLCQLYCSYGD